MNDIPTTLQGAYKNRFAKATVELDGIIKYEFIIDGDFKTLAILHELKRKVISAAFKLNRLCKDHLKKNGLWKF